MYKIVSSGDSGARRYFTRYQSAPRRTALLPLVDLYATQSHMLDIRTKTHRTEAYTQAGRIEGMG